jgi:hypothetical protein
VKDKQGCVHAGNNMAAATLQRLHCLVVAAVFTGAIDAELLNAGQRTQRGGSALQALRVHAQATHPIPYFECTVANSCLAGC